VELIDRKKIKYEKRTECFGHGEFFEVQKTYKESIDQMPIVEAIPVSVIKRAIAGISAADQCDQAAASDLRLRNSLEDVLKWYDTPVYKEYEKRTAR